MPIPRDDEFGLRPERAREHGVVGGVVDDGWMDDRGNDDGGQRRVAIEDFDRIQPAGFKLLGEFLAREYAAQFGEQDSAGRTWRIWNVRRRSTCRACRATGDPRSPCWYQVPAARRTSAR